MVGEEGHLPSGPDAQQPAACKTCKPGKNKPLGYACSHSGARCAARLFEFGRHSDTSHFACFAFRMFRISRREIGHFAFRGAKSDISHFVARNRTLYISRRETGHSGMTKYQIEDGARHSPRVCVNGMY